MKLQAMDIHLTASLCVLCRGLAMTQGAMLQDRNLGMLHVMSKVLQV